MSWNNTKSNKDHYIKFKLAIGCFSWCKCFYVMSNFEDLENIIHFGNFFGSIGIKTYFLALGTTPIKGVGFIAGKKLGPDMLSFKKKMLDSTRRLAFTVQFLRARGALTTST